MAQRICILEDDAGIREIIELILREEDYEVYGFANIASFNNANVNLNADLFLLDVMLPDGNGISICDQLKSNPDTKNIPVLMMSANASEREVNKTCKAEGFVAKPFDIYELIGKVNTFARA